MTTLLSNGLWTTPTVARELEWHARQDHPLEACGLLVGTGNQIVDVIAVENAAEHKQQAFQIDQQALDTYLPIIRGRGLRLLGFYHSHPNGAAIPSQHDVDGSLQNIALKHLIIGLDVGRSEVSYALWQIGPYKQVERLDFLITDIQPGLEQYGLSSAQVVAFYVGTLVAILFLIVLAISLLPPAPVITQ